MEFLGLLIVFSFEFLILSCGAASLAVSFFLTADFADERKWDEY